MTLRRRPPPPRGRRGTARSRSSPRLLPAGTAPPAVLLLAAAAITVARLLAGPASLAAQDRVTRSFGARHGLSAPTVFSLAQDSAGFLWLGTVGGLYRYDGVEMRPWAPGRIRGHVETVVVDASGRVLAKERRGTLWRIDAGGASPVVGPGGRWLTDVDDVAASGDGALWVLGREGRMRRRGPAGSWDRVDLPGTARSGEPRYVFPRGREGVDLATARGIWTLAPGSSPRRVAEADRVVDVLSLPDGRRVVVTFWRDTYVLEDGTLRKVADPPGRGIDAVRRGDVVWVSYDRYLARLGPEGGVEVLGPGDGLGGGPLLVDHEGSLWSGTFSGVLQYPEPETLVWADPHGLPSAHTRFVERAGDSVWVGTWQGVGRVERDGSDWVADSARGWMSRAEVVADAEGDLWVGSSEGLLELRAGRAPASHGDVGPILATAAGEGGAVWLGGDGLFRVESAGFGHERGSGPRRARGLQVPDGVRVTAAVRDDAGRIWAGVRERICRVRAASAVTSPSPAWTCWSIPGSVHFTSLHETATGSIWASSPYAGVLRFRDGRWEPLPGNATLPSRSVQNLVPSPSGGVWVVGDGVLRRVLPDPDAEDGWRVVERLSAWHGLPSPGGGDVHEDPDGTLWIATSRGLVRVPSSVRDRSPRPPRVALVEARVDDRRLDPAEAVELPHDRNRLELRFAALSYRAPSRVRYQVRLLPGSGWSDARTQPVVRWVDLDPGSHRAEIRASLDGERWTGEPASFGFEVLPPWYLAPRWIAAFAMAVLLLLLLGYRARVAHLLRLERQRTRIAMDLHDEMGAALGSVGIQAGILGRRDVDEERRVRLARGIAETAEALGTTLADMIWSLDPRPATLRDVAHRLEERGRRLFGSGATDFTVRWPGGWPPDDLPASVRRNVLLVGLEALQNAARHADADRVVLSLSRARARSGVWRLSVRDDGEGIAAAPGDTGGPRPAAGGASAGAGGDAAPAPEAEGRGLGLSSMRQRAGELDAEIDWRRPPTGGTEVALVFPLRGRVTARDRLRRWWFRLKDHMNVLLRRR